MYETLQGASWFMFAAFGSAIIMIFAGFIKWADKGTVAALPVLIVAPMAFTAGFSAMSKSDDMTRDWLDQRNSPNPPVQQQAPPTAGQERPLSPGSGPVA